MNFKAPRIVAAALLLLAAAPQHVQAQANTETFGQNRVQYRSFEWKFYDTKHFRIYHYDRSGPQLARYVAEQAEDDISIIEHKLGGQFPKQFNIVLYNSYDDYRQSNIGRKDDSQLQDVPAGTVSLVGDKLVVYFDGVHTDLHRQLRVGMSQVVMSRMLFGESFRQMVRNAVSNNLPEWVSAGYISYIVDGWDATAASQWKALLEANPGEGFFVLADKQPELAGKAFWKYISAHYGEPAVKSLLYAMQLKSSVNQGIKMALNMKVKAAYDSCIAFYGHTFQQDSVTRETPDTAAAILAIDVPKDNSSIRSIRVSPRGRDVAYVTFKEGEFKVYLQKTDRQQQRNIILTDGQKDYNEIVPDPDYPMMAWSNNGTKLAILYRRGLQTRLRIYNALRAKIENYIIPANRFDRVLSMAFNEENDRIILSAVKKSQTDLYSFTIKGAKLTNITNDLWDDVQPQYISGGGHNGILFMSNRTTPNMNAPLQVNDLPSGLMNLFYYDLKTLSPQLVQLTNAKGDLHISNPIQYGPDNYAFLCDSDGVYNRFVVTFQRDVHNMDSAVAVPATNYAGSIMSQQYNAADQRVYDVLQAGAQYRVYSRPVQVPEDSSGILPKVLAPTTLSIASTTHVSLQPLPAAVTNQMNEDEVADSMALATGGLKNGNTFQTEFKDTTAAAPTGFFHRKRKHQRDKAAEDTTALLDVHAVADSTYLKMKAKGYRLNFRPQALSARLDNTVLFNRYQPVDYPGEQYSNPDLGGLITASLEDELEDYKLTGGIRVPSSLSGMTYFLQYENFKHRLDWSVLYLRTAAPGAAYIQLIDTVTKQTYNDPVLTKTVSNLVQGTVSYPLDRIRSIRATVGVRQDVMEVKASDTFSLITPNVKRYWVQSRLEYVFDNSVPFGLNLRDGFRYKFYAEYFRKMNDGGGGFYNLGFDFRTYQQLYKHTILAIRFAGAHSQGNQHVLYYLGGVDNWLNTKYSDYNPSTPSQNYAFQTLATGLRGYKQNARSGNSYALTNFEIRFPVLSTLLKKPIRSALLRNLQLVPFVDAGSAWNGWLPNAESYEKSLTSSSNTVSMLFQLPNQYALCLGYGAGVRTTLLGYFLRLDAAWNIEGAKKPIWYISMGTDF